MKDVEFEKTLDDNDYLFSDAFTNIDLNIDMYGISDFIKDDETKIKLEKQSLLSDLRNENYNRYSDINILKYNDLPSDFSSAVGEIVDLYNSINVNSILNDSYSNSLNNKVLLDNIYRRISRLDNVVKSYLNQLTKQNDGNQKKFNLEYFNNLAISESLKKELITLYNDLVLQSSFVSSDIYEELDIQIKRKKIIDKIQNFLNIEESNNAKSMMKDRLKVLNIVINLEIERYNNKFNYLEDLMIEASKHENDFNEFKNFYNKIIAYDDTNYETARQTLDILNDDTMFKRRIEVFEKLFVEEREEESHKEKFIYEKVGIKNLENSLHYITINYYDKLTVENKSIINYIQKKLNTNFYDIEELNKALKLVVRGIWKTQLTDVYSFNPDDDYYFICSNNQFIDPKYQTILITKKELERVDDYEDYQIGFICNYNDNILYITESEDIMTVDEDDMSNLKTPLQLEQEFINFKVCNRIALNGYTTKIEAVYLIDDGNMEKHMKAIELANMYKLPLIKLKK